MNYRTLPYGAYPFDEVRPEDYRPLIEEGIAEKYRELDAIITNPEPATFDNTIVALERSGSKLDWITSLFYNLLHAEATDQLMALSQEINPALSALQSYELLSEPLFERIKSVWESRHELDLDEEDARLLERTWEAFSESGALLDESDKARLKEVKQQMSELSLHFSQHNLREQATYRLHVTDPASIEGLPTSALETARELAQSEGREGGWLFTLAAPSYLPFLQYSPDRVLRREIYEARMRLGATDGEFDNRPVIRQLVNLRLEYARLLGAPTYADKVLRRRMAGSREAVYGLLDELLAAYRPVAERELAEVTAFAHSEGFVGQLEPWDWAYWSERYKQKYYELDEEELRPYFELSRVSAGVFGLATRLYGITFHERTDLPRYHQDVHAYEVRREGGEYLGLLYTDFFPRPSKKSGAWMSNLQEQYHTPEGEDHRPHIVLVMNFTPPTADSPALLTPSEVRTFLHEFGHSLHGLFAESRYASLSGTNVVRDFVELPSQLMENWLDEPAWLSEVARHYQTGQALPESLIERMQRARHFLVGYAACRQLSFGLLDMAWHTLTEPVSETLDVKAFEEEAWQRAAILPASPAGCVMSTAFGHIFAGGYSAGYYGYKWAEVLDADAFEAFREEGIFSRDTAERFRREVLSQGDKRDARQLYRAFRGKEASVRALLQRDGL